MYAFEIPNLRYSLPASAEVAEHRFLKVGANSTAVQATAGAAVIGVSTNAVETNAGVTATQQVVEIADGIVLVEAGAAITVGSVVYSDADGKATSTKPGSGDTFAAGVAFTAATAAGEVITVKTL